MEKKSIFLSKNKEVLNMEVWTISNTLKIIIQKTLYIPVIIIYNFQKVLRVI